MKKEEIKETRLKEFIKDHYKHIYLLYGDKILKSSFSLDSDFLRTYINLMNIFAVEKFTYIKEGEFKLLALPVDDIKKSKFRGYKVPVSEGNQLIYIMSDIYNAISDKNKKILTARNLRSILRELEICNKDYAKLTNQVIDHINIDVVDSYLYEDLIKDLDSVKDKISTTETVCLKHIIVSAEDNTNNIVLLNVSSKCADSSRKYFERKRNK